MGTSGTSFRLSDEVKEQFLKIADSIGAPGNKYLQN